MSQEYVLTIPSLGRAETFTALDAFAGLDCRKFIFVDNRQERRAYKLVVGKRAKVIDCDASPPWSVSHVRNAAFDHFGKGAHVLCLCDDVKALHILDASQKRKLRKLTIEEIEKLIARGFSDVKKVGTKLWGVYPVKNAFYMKDKVSSRVFIIDAFSGVIVGDLRWDEEQQFKGDYDLTIQHISQYGCIVRYDSICVDAPYNTTEGGCLTYRTPSAEADAIERLKAKWPHFVHDNPRRFNEILLRFPKSGSKKRVINKKRRRV